MLKEGSAAYRNSARKGERGAGQILSRPCARARQGMQLAQTFVPTSLHRPHPAKAAKVYQLRLVSFSTYERYIAAAGGG